MTAIAYRDGVMAADTAVWFGEVIAGQTQKIHRFPDGHLFAAQGDSIYIEAYVQWRREGGEVPEKAEKDEDFFGIGVDRGGVVYWVPCSYKMQRAAIAPYYAAGAVSDFLHGALAAGATAEEAVRLAIEHCAFAAGKVQVERL